MAIKVQGVEDAVSLLKRVESEAPKAAFRELYRVGEKVRDTAKLMAPYKEGWLTDAIKIDPEDPNTPAERGRNGQFLAKLVTIYVDEYAPGEDGRLVGDYADKVNEEVRPAGDLNLGEGSQEKQAGNPEGEEVGGAFLDRAAEVVESELDFLLQMSLGGFL